MAIGFWLGARRDDVGGGQRRELLVGRVLDRGQALGLAADRVLEQVADEAGVAEAPGARLGVDDRGQPGGAGLVEVVLAARRSSHSKIATSSSVV